MQKITILHEGTPKILAVDPRESVSLLRHQIWSLTGVEIDEQSLTGIGPGKLEGLDNLPVSALGHTAGSLHEM